MTFTALIASVSHILIHPVIFFEKWPILILCMSISTFTSLYSARFANRVSNKTVGLCTGGILTVLGIFLLILHYWTSLSQITLLVQTLQNLQTFILFILPCLVVLLLIYFFGHVPKYIFRKMLHLVAFTGITLVMTVADNYQSVCTISLLLALLIYPILSLLENETWFAKLFVQKKKGEIKMSLLMLMAMFAFITYLSWGIFGNKYLAGASILMWGFGDGMAALIGIPFGKHKVSFADGKKSWEGTIAMFVSAFLIGYVFLYFQGVQALSISFCAALMAAFVELISPSIWDTVTTPISILTILLFMA